jgi:hypothetical protein
MSYIGLFTIKDINKDEARIDTRESVVRPITSTVIPSTITAKIENIHE